MEVEKSNLYLKIFALIFGITLLCIVMMIVLSFFAPKINQRTIKFENSNNIDTIWYRITDTSNYKATRKELIKINRFNPRSWVEYYSSRDSQQVKVSTFSKYNYTYSIINKKYEQYNRFNISLSTKSDNTTFIELKEYSIYQNVWARLHNSLLFKNISIDTEKIKIENLINKKSTYKF